MVVKKNKPARNLLFWLAAGVVIIVLWSVLQTPSLVKSEVSFSQFLDDVEARKVEQVEITGSEVKGRLKDGTAFKTILPAQYPDLVKDLRANAVATIDVKDTTKAPWFSYILTWFPLLIIVVFWFMMMRQMQSGGNKALSFGKSRAKLFSPVQKKVTFKDVAGI